jgi:hypothetical protein
VAVDKRDDERVGPRRHIISRIIWICAPVSIRDRGGLEVASNGGLESVCSAMSAHAVLRDEIERQGTE